MSQRSPEFERDFLRQATKGVGLGAIGFERQAGDRLAAGQELYGDQALTTSLRELLRELGDEALDLGAWGALTAQCEDVYALDDDVRARVIHLLIQIAGRGAEVKYLIRQLLDELP